MKIHKSDDQKNIGVVQFLEAYEKQENLWNPAIETYKNKAARDTSYMTIIKELGKPNLSIMDIKLKIKSIRTTYTKELRLVTKHKEQGKPYIPKLFWFNRANTFLKDVSLSRDRRASYSEAFKTAGGTDGFKNSVMDYITDDLSHVDQDDSNFEYKTIASENMANIHHTDIHMNDVPNVDAAKSSILALPQTTDFSLTTVTNNHNSAKFPTTETRFVDTNFLHTNSNNAHQAYSQSGTQTAPIEDEFELFCRSVAAQLRSISDIYSRSVAKLKIQQILFEAETGHYRNTSVTIPTAADSQQLNAI